VDPGIKRKQRRTQFELTGMGTDDAQTNLRRILDESQTHLKRYERKSGVTLHTDSGLGMPGPAPKEKVKDDMICAKRRHPDDMQTNYRRTTDDV
jgi:hypothetical protein